MKYIYCALVACLFAMQPMAAHAATYAEVHAGSTMNTQISGVNLSDDTTFGVEAGTSVGPFRVAAGYDRINADSYSANIHADNLSATAYLDFNVTDNTAVSVGAGVDYARGEANIYTYHKSKDDTGYHITGQLAHRVSPGLIAVAAVTHEEIFSGHGDRATVGFRFAL